MVYFKRAEFWHRTRFTMAALARLFDWKNALVVVKPDTLVRWHRKGFRLFWRWKSRHKGRCAFYLFIRASRT